MTRRPQTNFCCSSCLGQLGAAPSLHPLGRKAAQLPAQIGLYSDSGLQPPMRPTESTHAEMATGAASGHELYLQLVAAHLRAQTRDDSSTIP